MSGFSQPDPAPVPGGGDGEDITVAAREGALVDLLDDTVDCRQCSHYPVCAIINGIRPMFEKWNAGDPDDEPPVDPVRLAAICRAFDPADDGGDE